MNSSKVECPNCGWTLELQQPNKRKTPCPNCDWRYQDALDMVNVRAERDTYGLMLMLAADQAFKSEVIDTGMLMHELEGLPREVGRAEFEADWKETWIESLREQVEDGES